MAHAGEKFRFSLVGLFRSGLGIGEFRLNLPTFGQVLRQFSKATQISILPPDRRKDYIGPEGRTVFAGPQPFVLEPPLERHDVQVSLRDARSDVFRGIKAREMLANNFLRGVTFDSLCAGVPAYNEP